jgi:antitoxin HigA-1
MIGSFKNRALRRLWETNDPTGMSATARPRIARILSILESGESIQDLDVPGFRFHVLSGFDPRRYSMRVTGNWRITVACQDGVATAVDRRTFMALKRALPPVHPGEILREDVLPALGLSVVGAAENLGVTRQTLHRIIARKDPRPVTPEMAVRLGKLCGNRPKLWLNLQAAYDLWKAERRVDTRKIPTLHAAD